MILKRIAAGDRMSQAILANGFLFTAAQVAKDLDADATTQARQVLEKIDALLAETGIDKTQVVSASIWIADIADYAAVNEAWDAWVVKGQTPVRACVEAKFSSPRIKVEIQIVAAAS